MRSVRILEAIFFTACGGTAGLHEQDATPDSPFDRHDAASSGPDGPSERPDAATFVDASRPDAWTAWTGDPTNACGTQPELEIVWTENEDFLGMDTDFLFYDVDTTPSVVVGDGYTADHRLARADGHDELIGGGEGGWADFVSDGQQVFFTSVGFATNREGDLRRSNRDGSNTIDLGGGFGSTTDNENVFLDEPMGGGEAIVRIAKSDLSRQVLVPTPRFIGKMRSDGTTLVYALPQGLYEVPVAGGTGRLLVGGDITNFDMTEGLVFFASATGIDRVPLGGGPPVAFAGTAPSGAIFADDGQVVFGVDKPSPMLIVASAQTGERIAEIETSFPPVGLHYEGSCLYYGVLNPTVGTKALWRVVPDGQHPSIPLPRP